MEINGNNIEEKKIKEIFNTNDRIINYFYNEANNNYNN